MLTRFNRTVLTALAFLENSPPDNVLPSANKAGVCLKVLFGRITQLILLSFLLINVCFILTFA